jgi:hypothetical protein
MPRVPLHFVTFWKTHRRVGWPPPWSSNRFAMNSPFSAPSNTHTLICLWRADAPCEPSTCIENAGIWNGNGAKPGSGYKRCKHHGSRSAIVDGTKWNRARTKRLALQKLWFREQGAFLKQVEPSGTKQEPSAWRYKNCGFVKMQVFGTKWNQARNQAPEWESLGIFAKSGVRPGTYYNTIKRPGWAPGALWGTPGRLE